MVETKKFGKAIFVRHGVYMYKAQAVAAAKKERSYGHLARVTKEWSGWKVWTKKKSPYG